jgi:hypothetical protein
MPASAPVEIKPIKNTRDYQRALKEIEGLMHAKRKTPEGDRLDVLVCPRRGLGGKTLADRGSHSMQPATFQQSRAFKRRLKPRALFLSTTTEARASGFG